MCGCRTEYKNIVMYLFSNNTVSWSTPQMFYLYNTDCYYLLGRLTTPRNTVKASTCAHHSFLAAVMNSHNVLSCSYIWLNWRNEFSTEKNSTFYSSHHDRFTTRIINVHWKSFFCSNFSFLSLGIGCYAQYMYSTVLGHYYRSQSELTLWFLFVSLIYCYIKLFCTLGVKLKFY
jgi:hypothetical protein